MSPREAPYVGPRPLQVGDPIFGRDRAIDRVRASLIANRVVLLYAASGAGKSSLLEAGLRPQLTAKSFQVLKTARVGLDPQRDHQQQPNRYVASTIHSMGLEVSEAESLDRAVRILDSHHPDQDPCLLFDQFEELFTLDSTDIEAKREFLTELSVVLADRSRWALFSMREDYIAHLDPYLDFFPDRLDTRIRLEMLTEREAMEAIVRPAEEFGVTFEESAAQRLVDDLRRVSIEGDGGPVQSLGPFVEPVQLQVVCRQMWDRRPSNAAVITVEDVANEGTVDEALGAFYDDSVSDAATSTRVSERTIRTWFETDLISGDGFRMQTREGPFPRGRDILNYLEGRHIIRADRIRGAKWYELSHDRFVAPILASNSQRRSATLRRRLVIAGVSVGAAVALVVGFIVSAVLAPDLVAQGVRQGPVLRLDAETTDEAINEPDERVHFPLEPTDQPTEVLVQVKPKPGADLIPDVLFFEDQDAITSAAGTELLSDQPWLLAASLEPSRDYEVRVAGTSGTTGDFEIDVESIDGEDGALDVGTSIEGNFSGDGEPAVHRLAATSEEVVLMRVTDPAGGGPAPVRWMAAFREGFHSERARVGNAELIDEEPTASRDDVLMALNPASGEDVFVVLVPEDQAKGDYSIEIEGTDFDVDDLSEQILGEEPSTFLAGGTSVNCKPWDHKALNEEVTLTSAVVDSHYLWLWDAQFSSPEGVKSYLDSFGSGDCIAESEEFGITSTRTEIGGTTVVEYVTHSPDDIRTNYSSGVVIVDGLLVREAELVSLEATEEGEAGDAIPGSNERLRSAILATLEPER